MIKLQANMHFLLECKVLSTYNEGIQIMGNTETATFEYLTCVLNEIDIKTLV